MSGCEKCGSNKAYWSIKEKDGKSQNYCDDCFNKYGLADHKREMDEYHKTQRKDYDPGPNVPIGYPPPEKVEKFFQELSENQFPRQPDKYPNGDDLQLWFGSLKKMNNSQLMHIMKNWDDEFCKDARNTINSGKDLEDNHLVCPICYEYLGIRKELKVKAGNVPTNTDGVYFISDAIYRCPKCKAEVFI